MHDYAEARLPAIEAYSRALQLSPGLPEAVYFRGRAAKSVCLWRGWDEQMRDVRRALRTPGGATAMGIDPVASLSYPFTAPEFLLVVTEARARRSASKLLEPKAPLSKPHAVCPSPSKPTRRSLPHTGLGDTRTKSADTRTHTTLPPHRRHCS